MRKPNASRLTMAIGYITLAAMSPLSAIQNPELGLGDRILDTPLSAHQSATLLTAAPQLDPIESIWTHRRGLSCTYRFGLGANLNLSAALYQTQYEQIPATWSIRSTMDRTRPIALGIDPFLCQ